MTVAAQQKIKQENSTANLDLRLKINIPTISNTAESPLALLLDRWYNFLSLIIISKLMSRSNVLKLTNENNNGSITCLSMLSANATNAYDRLRYWGSLGHTDSDTVTQTGDLDVHSRLHFARLQPPETLHTYAMIQPYNFDPHKRGVINL